MSDKSDTPRTDALMMESGASLYWLEHLRRTEYFARQLERELTAAQKDAERYRWIRKAGAWESEIGLDYLSENPDSYDAAIDAAIAAERKT